MRTRHFKLIAMTILAFAALLAVWLVVTSAPAVHLRVIELTTDSHGLWAPPIGRQCAYAVIEATNTSRFPIIYRSPLTFMPGRPQFARAVVSYQCGSGWSPHPVFRLG